MIIVIRLLSAKMESYFNHSKFEAVVPKWINIIILIRVPRSKIESYPLIRVLRTKMESYFYHSKFEANNCRRSVQQFEQLLSPLRKKWKYNPSLAVHSA
jgi:hypothetical protein